MQCKAPSTRFLGFTLVEIAVVLVVLGLLAAMMIGMTASLLTQQRYQLTRSRLANTEAALALFVSQNKRLPCPADGTVVSGAANGGIENEVAASNPRVCVNNQRDGVAPWRALGLTASDVEDGWGARFTYRVGPELVVNNAMDFSSCDPAGGNATTFATPLPYCNPAGVAGTQCNASTLLTMCTPPTTALVGTAGKGLVVTNVAGIIIMDPRGTVAAPVSTGAAYVLISNGQEGGGGYNGQGILQGSGTAAGTAEAMNFANLTYTAPPALPAAATSFLVDDVLNAVGTTHFDDLIVRPSILAVAIKAQLGPRSR